MEKNKQAKLLFSETIDSIFIHTFDGQILAINEAACDVLDYTREEALKKPIDKLLPDYHYPAKNELIITESPLLKEGLLTKKSGETFPVEIHIFFGELNDETVVITRTRDISKQKKTELELKEKAERFQDLVETASDWIWELDNEANFTYVGPQVESILGFTPEELIGTSAYDLMPTDEVKRISKKFSVFVEKETPFFNMDNINIHKDGHRVILESSGIPFYDKTGKIQGYRGMDRDITERKKAHEQIRSRLALLSQPSSDISQLSFNDLFDISEIQKIQDAFSKSSNVASIITDTEGIPITKPSNFCHLCMNIIRKTEKGLANCICSDKVLGRLNPDGPVMQPCLSGGLWDGGASICVGDRHIANWLIGQVRNDTQHEDEIMEYCQTIGADEDDFRKALRDVPVMSTEQFSNVCEALFLFAKQLSNLAFQNLQQGRYISEIQQSEQALRESEENYREIFNSSTSGILIVDVNSGDITDLNQTLQTMLHAAKEDLLGQHVSTLVDDETAKINDLIHQTQTGGTQTLERPIKRFDAGFFWAEMSFKRTKLAGQKRILVKISDITERKHAEQQHMLLQEQLRQSHKMEAIGQLAGGIAHDFNNLLTGILGNAELLEMNLPENSDETDFARQIKKASCRAADLTKQLLAFSRKGKLQTSSVDIHEYIIETIKILKHSIDKRITINQELNAIPSTVMGDPSQLQNAFLNLAVNARDAMPSGGELNFLTQLVHISERIQHPDLEKLPAGDYIEIRISDTGEGMTKEIQKHIFEPFFTTKATGKGTGLGLASVYGCIRSHSGQITVDSKCGKGTTFSVLLPANTSPKTPKQPNKTQPPAKGNGHILLVDDEEIIREILGHSLTRLGYAVHCCADGAEAVEYVHNHADKIDLIILDIIMPRLSGEDALKQIHQLAPQLPVIVTSGFSKNETITNMLNNGARDFLNKPFKTDELAKKIAQHIWVREV